MEFSSLSATWVRNSLQQTRTHWGVCFSSAARIHACITRLSRGFLRGFTSWSGKKTLFELLRNAVAISIPGSRARSQRSKHRLNARESVVQCWTPVTRTGLGNLWFSRNFNWKSNLIFFTLIFNVSLEMLRFQKLFWFSGWRNIQAWP